MNSAIQRLAQLHGVADTWLDYRGHPREVSLESRAAILAAMGVDASEEASARRRDQPAGDDAVDAAWRRRSS